MWRYLENCSLKKKFSKIHLKLCIQIQVNIRLVCRIFCLGKKFRVSTSFLGGSGRIFPGKVLKLIGAAVQSSAF